jgi:predicted metalloprotease with PDZ domain
LTRDGRKDTYGFNLKAVKDGSYILSNVVANQAADRAGVKNDDYILEVNGKSVEGMDREDVIDRINSDPKHVDLLVVNGLEGYLKALNNKPIERDQSQQQQKPYVNEIEGIIRHNIRILPKEKLGVTLKNNAIITDIEPNSPSAKAGMKKGYKIAEINGIDVRDKSNLEIGNLINQNEKNLIIGVVPTSDLLLQDQTKPIVETGIKDSLANAINELSPVSKPTHPQITSQSVSDLSTRAPLTPQTAKKLTGKTYFYFNSISFEVENKAPIDVIYFLLYKIILNNI